MANQWGSIRMPKATKHQVSDAERSDDGDRDPDQLADVGTRCPAADSWTRDEAKQGRKKDRKHADDRREPSGTLGPRAVTRIDVLLEPPEVGAPGEDEQGESAEHHHRLRSRAPN